MLNQSQNFVRFSDQEQDNTEYVRVPSRSSLNNNNHNSNNSFSSKDNSFYYTSLIDHKTTTNTSRGTFLFCLLENTTEYMHAHKHDRKKILSFSL